MKNSPAKSIPAGPAREELLSTLRRRFEKNPHRHKGMDWEAVLARLEAAPAKMASLQEMEGTGGEPDVTGQDAATGAFLFMDCSPETPSGRRSICYDREGLESRREHRPENTAIDLAESMGVRLLTEEEYRALQQLGEFDNKTSSWILTPAPVRRLGGALFCDRRYGQVFTYHNGAQSYYAARGFRSVLTV